MKKAYKIALEKDNDTGIYIVKIPDFDAVTQGKDIADSINMARDLICVGALANEDLGKEIPEPNSKEFKCNKDDIITYVDVDIDLYRKKASKKRIKKTLTIPSWLNEAAEEEGLNFSRILEDALNERLS